MLEPGKIWLNLIAYSRQTFELTVAGMSVSSDFETRIARASKANFHVVAFMHAVSVAIDAFVYD